MADNRNDQSSTAMVVAIVAVIAIAVIVLLLMSRRGTPDTVPDTTVPQNGANVNGTIDLPDADVDTQTP